MAATAITVILDDAPSALLRSIVHSQLGRIRFERIIFYCHTVGTVNQLPHFDVAAEFVAAHHNIMRTVTHHQSIDVVAERIVLNRNIVWIPACAVVDYHPGSI